MDSEPLRMADGLVWYLHSDEVTHLHHDYDHDGEGCCTGPHDDDRGSASGLRRQPHELYARVREIVPEKTIDEPSG
jgi:hypothetical protein